MNPLYKVLTCCNSGLMSVGASTVKEVPPFISLGEVILYVFCAFIVYLIIRAIYNSIKENLLFKAKRGWFSEIGIMHAKDNRYYVCFKVYGIWIVSDDSSDSDDDMKRVNDAIKYYADKRDDVVVAELNRKKELEERKKRKARIIKRFNGNELLRDSTKQRLAAEHIEKILEK